MLEQDHSESKSQIKELVKKREDARKKKQFDEADRIRKEIETLGYTLTDTKSGPKANKTLINAQKPRETSGLIALFGSGEMSPTGRRIHEFLIKDLPPPVKIALLETPAGFEVNPHNWYQKLKTMMETGLANARPAISLVPALRNDGEQSTNDEKLLLPLAEADYIHTGAGSPTYAARHLRGSRAWELITTHVQHGRPSSFASAAALAMGKYLLPVYEIYKVGEDLHWDEGLDLFSQFGFNLTIITHWNNAEGGKEIDTSRCYMGKERFSKLLKLLPGPSTILGIDEQTACILDVKRGRFQVIGAGGALLIHHEKEIYLEHGQTYPLS